MKDTETDKDNAAEVQNSSNLDEESAEMLKAAYRKENISSEDQGDEYRTAMLAWFNRVPML